MSKIQKSFICLAIISIFCGVLANCSSDDSSDPPPKKKSSSSSAGNNTPSVTLSCTGLQKNVEKGGTIDIPDLGCSNGRTPTNEVWNIPDGNWKVDPNTNATSFTISVTATCGSVELVDVSCGKVNVIAAAGGSSSSRGGSSSSSGPTVTLTCTGLQKNVAKGGTIEEPILECSNDEEPEEVGWTGRPTGGWTVSANTSAVSYTITVSAFCGEVRQVGISCGTVNVTTASSSSRGSSSSRAVSSSSRGSSGSNNGSSGSNNGSSGSNNGSSGSNNGSSGSNNGSSSSRASSSSGRYITCKFAKGSYTVGEDVLTPEIKCFESNGTPYTRLDPVIGNAVFSASSGIAPANLAAWKSENGATKFSTAGTSAIVVSKVECGTTYTNLGATCTPSLTIDPVAPTTTYTLACADLTITTGTVGKEITPPAVTCKSNEGVITTPAATSLTWTGAPAWANPAEAATYTAIKVTTNAGNCAGKTAVPCAGTLTVSPAPTLSCSQIQTAPFIIGSTPALPQPTLTCNGQAVTSGNTTLTFTPTATSWATAIATANTYTVTAKATAGDCKDIPAASCGTLKVIKAELTCDALTLTSVVAGTAIAASSRPAVKCDGVAVPVADIDWTPTTPTIDWTDLGVGTYTVKAKATAGDCSTKPAVACGTTSLTVHPKLTCGPVTSTPIAVGVIPPKPTLTCGAAATPAPTAISWLPAEMNVATTATTAPITGVKAKANCGGTIEQEATCSGTITVAPEEEEEEEH